MTNPSGGGPSSGPPGSTPEDRLKAFQKKVADLTAENQAPRRNAVDPLAYSSPGMAQTQIDAIYHNKIVQQRAQQQGQPQGQQQKPAALRPGDDPAHAQSGIKEISDAHRQRNQGSQPDRYRELMNASQAQQASNSNGGQGRSGP